MNEAKFDTPVAGDVVVLHDHITGHYTYGTVLSLIPGTTAGTSGKNGEPALTVAVPKAGDRRELGTPDWHRAYDRISPILHESHDAVEQGTVGVTWVCRIPAAYSIAKNYFAVNEPVVPAEPVEVDTGTAPFEGFQAPVEGAPASPAEPVVIPEQESQTAATPENPTVE